MIHDIDDAVSMSIADAKESSTESNRSINGNVGRLKTESNVCKNIRAFIDGIKTDKSM